MTLQEFASHLKEDLFVQLSKVNLVSDQRQSIQIAALRMPELWVQLRDDELADLFYAMNFLDLVEAGCLSEDVSYRNDGWP